MQKFSRSLFMKKKTLQVPAVLQVDHLELGKLQIYAWLSLAMKNMKFLPGAFQVQSADGGSWVDVSFPERVWNRTMVLSVNWQFTTLFLFLVFLKNKDIVAWSNIESEFEFGRREA